MVADQSFPGHPSQPHRAKYRIRFRKEGDLRLVSHHDLMHCFERMARRAALPLAQTQGFHPHPRLTFAQALALGNTGAAEVVEVELTEALDADLVHARLARETPAGLEILSARAIDFRKKAQVRRAGYRLPVPDIPELPGRCRDLLARAEIWIERSRPQPRRFDLRPYLDDVHVAAGMLHVSLWVSAFGAARPEEVAGLLGLQALLEDGAYFERTHLELTDEISDSAPVMPAALRAAPRKNGPAPGKTAKSPAAPKPIALMDNPLSFET